MEGLRSWSMGIVSYRKAMWIVFLIYMIYVAQHIVFKRLELFNTPMLISLIREDGIGVLFRVANFIPFKTIVEYVEHYMTRDIPTRIIYMNLIGNILAFIPMGMIIPELKKSYEDLRSVVRYSLKIIIGVEFSQLLLFVGTFDIDDMILNMIGVFIGYLLNLLCWRLLKLIIKRVDNGVVYWSHLYSAFNKKLTTKPLNKDECHTS